MERWLLMFHFSISRYMIRRWKCSGMDAQEIRCFFVGVWYAGVKNAASREPGCPTPCSALTLFHSCRWSPHVPWWAQHSNNRQACGIRSCHTLDWSSSRISTAFAFLFQSVSRISETQGKGQPPVKTFYVNSTKGHKSQGFWVAHILGRIFKVNDW